MSPSARRSIGLGLVALAAADTDGYSIGRFTVTGFLGPSQIELRARSRDGLLSRDGQPIACFAGDELSDPKWRLAGVRFTGADRSS
jgi:hypothetical protein